MALPSSRPAYAITGFILGAAAPISAFLIRLMTMPAVRVAPFDDLRANAFFYIYQLIGTSLVFAIAGWLAGARAEKLEQAENFYQSLAEHDPLTGLYNDRAFRDRYSRAIERASRMQQPVSLLLIDVDHLKRINDKFGHRTGNKALIHVAQALREAKRSTDSAARWGGDEFAILLEGADAAATQRVAESVLTHVREKPVPFTRGQLAASVSIGAVCATEFSKEVDLFNLADEALYTAKRGGRNRLEFATAPAPS
jgi:diguanylate cyclase (GGDEF)-like protein